MNEKTGTGVSSEKEKVKESQSRSVTPLLDTPSGVGLGASQIVLQIQLKNQLKVLTLEIRDYSLRTLLNLSEARVTPLLSQMKLC